MKVWPGQPYPLGATWDGAGVNFALFSENATAVDLCLFERPDGAREAPPSGSQNGPIRSGTSICQKHVQDSSMGIACTVRMSLRPATGSTRPNSSWIRTPRRLLEAFAGVMPCLATRSGIQMPTCRGTHGTAPRTCRSASSSTRPSVGGRHAPPHPWHKTLIYELHVKGFTARHPEVPPALRGTYAGLTCPAVIDYLCTLGITAVELMPVQQFVADKHLVDQGLTNYWGYNSIGFFAPDACYASTDILGQQVAEFKTMVKTLHREGIEVILDVVYNHTGEGNHLGPTLCFRGIDNAAYYRLMADDRRYYMDYTGCGNTLNMTHPCTLQLIMDSLRYWVLEMHVDGFRFDLASTLARELHEVDRLGAFFDIIHQDPVLSQVKLIAEPWDLGEGGYQVGNFPILWAEWNAAYRDTVRRFWKGDGNQVGGLAFRLTGSSDLYEWGGRRPHASINYVTAHDGFTLHDLVSYNEKHNAANGEGNQDGSNENLSWNCGAEGPTDDPAILALRARQQRNFLATLFLSQGVPMLLAGDELGRTQRGNNNAYCQDNELSWWTGRWIGHGASSWPLPGG